MIRITEEQWERLIGWYRLMGREQAVQGLTTAKQFHEGMEQIQRSAGHPQEELREVSQALLSIANGEEGGAN